MADLTQTVADLTTEVTGIKTSFDTFKGNVATRVATLQEQLDALTNQANPDLSGLQAAIDDLKGDVDSATA